MSVHEAKQSNFRLLILAPSSSHASVHEPDQQSTRYPQLFPPFLTALTNAAPSPDLLSFAGYTTHPPLSLRTKYYSADVSLWCDELPTVSENSSAESDVHPLSQWTSQMLSVEAREVREVIGGIVILLPHISSSVLRSTTRSDYIQYISAVNQVREVIEDEFGRDIATLVVIQDVTPAAVLERSAETKSDAIDLLSQQLEDACLSDHGLFGWDVIPCQRLEKSASPSVNNEYREKRSMDRVIEVLEQTDWLAPCLTENGAEEVYGLVPIDEFVDLSDDDMTTTGMKPEVRLLPQKTETDAITEQSDEFQREIMELKFALEDQAHDHRVDAGEGEEIEVEELAELMGRIVAIREAASEMEKGEREKFARREIATIMKNMDFGK